MTGRRIALYFAWSRPDEVAAPLGVLEDRFPALHELRAGYSYDWRARSTLRSDFSICPPQ